MSTVAARLRAFENLNESHDGFRYALWLYVASMTDEDLAEHCGASGRLRRLPVPIVPVGGDPNISFVYHPAPPVGGFDQDDI